MQEKSAKISVAGQDKGQRRHSVGVFRVKSSSFASSRLSLKRIFESVACRAGKYHFIFTTPNRKAFFHHQHIS
jgi:hypothetical protein